MPPKSVWIPKSRRISSWRISYGSSASFELTRVLSRSFPFKSKSNGPAKSGSRPNFDAAIAKAVHNLDQSFLLALWEAFSRVKGFEGGDAKALNQSLDHNLAGAVVVVFGELRKDLGRPPKRPEVRARIEQYQREAGLRVLSDRNWRRVCQHPSIAALFRGTA
jgi:hypothetical protein